jgi:hypothetical protein
MTMARLAVAAILAAVVWVPAGTAKADWFARVCHKFHLEKMRVRTWPHPWTEIDTESVREPFCIMTANGWRRQNTLADHHFEQGTSELSKAGMLKVEWILSAAPEQYRTIFVERVSDPETMARRMEAVQTAIGKLCLDGQPPEVQEVIVIHPGSPADYIDTIDRKYRDSIPEPRLPAAKHDSAG